MAIKIEKVVTKIKGSNPSIGTCLKGNNKQKWKNRK